MLRSSVTCSCSYCSSALEIQPVQHLHTSWAESGSGHSLILHPNYLTNTQIQLQCLLVLQSAVSEKTAHLENFKDSSGRVTLSQFVREAAIISLRCLGQEGVQLDQKPFMLLQQGHFFIPVSLTLLAFHFSLNQLSGELILT